MAPTIKEKTDLCLAAFRSLATSLRSETRVSNEYDRLQLWIHDARVCDGTLDEALISSSSLRELTMSLLNELHDQLTAPDEEFLEEVKDIIDNLVSLEPALGSPAPLDDLQCKEPSESQHVVAPTAGLSKLTTVAHNSNFLTGKPDLDIVIVTGFAHLSPLMRFTQDGISAPHLEWLERSLPEILEENSIYARMLTYDYDAPPRRLGWSVSSVAQYDFIEFFTRAANNLVRGLNRARLSDPARPLFFVSEGLGVIITKQTALTLVKEGLSVDVHRPICGCMILEDPEEASTEYFKSSMEIHPSLDLPSGIIRALILEDPRIRLQVGPFETLAKQYDIKSVTMQFHQRGPFTIISAKGLKDDADHSWNVKPDFSDREAVLPIAHIIASIAGKSISDRADDLDASPMKFRFLGATAGTANQSEDPFAMLVAYDTAILINDASLTSPSVWTSIIEIVRDCVDVVITYRDDVDIQLCKSESTSFSVTEGAKASRILGDVSPAGVSWDLDAQLRRYIRKYIASDFSVLPEGMLRPCNMIILTEHAPEQDPISFMNALSNVVAQSSRLPFGDLRLGVQFVLLGIDPQANAFFKQLDDIATMNKASNAYQQIAPTFRLPAKYKSNAEICKRILLGAISPRFAATAFSAKESLLPGHSRDDGDSASITAGSDSAGYSEAQWSDFVPSTSPSTVDESMLDYNPPLISIEASPVLEARKDPMPKTLYKRGRSYSNPDVFGLGEISRLPSLAAESSARSQKHPATFQCHLCPKKFTRAYNLRSHLRAHMDERPFVCSVCGKAFARQHDRKRHEGLHSDEKKFVCRGELAVGGHWGCGRRFARADALFRHFHSEAGRICIKPLLEQEAREKQQGGMGESSSSGLDVPYTQLQGFQLPAALLAQYPALQNVDSKQELPVSSEGREDHLESDFSDMSDGSTVGARRYDFDAMEIE
ncbi:uncharacterized protein A1O9_08519 [Exophiala aquamarina CBS 119918]|uniref:C2H2-type domain-containing protein n=1 Tax=Exophiala aquamarina CBS 119918 TaxID=1182545 RepID=A0A072P943_9EURO|nr:uncharacterized protein A1O9_08519 [Exophiala aquamarina CBS 119918]KEF55768.1 hypothetical protein A1O9_08519 [Exophiala aquamarina CBS 119918]